ncbi:hypothetical protein [Geitlerinema calcuttense]|uniref:hypothetical protein n=1 Tax=Geitlerinema calcuttense TaxID=1471433 RepID=UPI00255B9711|nr:hypothetical protein [Geitlerinema calcuttense]
MQARRQPDLAILTTPCGSPYLWAKFSPFFFILSGKIRSGCGTGVFTVWNFYAFLEFE